MKKIIDKFTNVPFSRQYKYQLRKHKQKKCIICGGKLSLKSRKYCEFHRRNEMVLNRENYRRYNKSKKRYFGAESYKYEKELIYESHKNDKSI